VSLTAQNGQATWGSRSVPLAPRGETAGSIALYRPPALYQSVLLQWAAATLPLSQTPSMMTGLGGALG